ncbi:hypothetical protein Uis1B_0746 [Bifidobacterium margollesii]|uniref:Uncharacterized protein n=1 Tax=Bifidobacterium margollesii TaxID=2020964 RepID=A0A2N5JB26_9BIFI|nr:hypothetical protein [Bifidobacterium margollesii]PLS31405.1 hypothetical protein Uis1B_0746 [Bifidobacterium margollesii]
MQNTEYTKPSMTVITLAGADIVRTSAGDTDVPWPGTGVSAK